MVSLTEITPDNWRCNLAVRKDQASYVASSTGLLARAYAYRASRAQARLIVRDETPVGMALWYDLPEMDAYDFSQLLIDARYQGQGCGLQAATLVLEEMRRDGRYAGVYLCYIQGNEAARKLYEKLGFTRTWDDDGDELVMYRSLRTTGKQSEKGVHEHHGNQSESTDDGHQVSSSGH